VLLLQEPHANPSASSLLLGQSNQSDSPNGKITHQCVCLWWQKRHWLVKSWKYQKAVSTLPHEANALLELFCLQPIVFGWRQN